MERARPVTWLTQKRRAGSKTRVARRKMGDFMQASRDLIIEGVGLDVDVLPRPLDWAQVFGDDHPVELEIGTGKGTFLTEQAKARPEVSFLGVEWANWFYRYAADRLRRNGCSNARMVRAEAMYFLSEFVADGSISVLHVYFPDPWPKKRHHKRRLVQEPFLRQAERILAPGGRVQIVSDHRGYFEENIEPTLKSSRVLRVVDYNRPGSAAEGEFVGTNFERKYRREGRPFYALSAVKG
jgi:tRNA (guanine-N7-)-methyltransferase